MEKILPYLPQIIKILTQLITNIIEITKGMSEEETKKYLDMTFDDITAKERLKRNADGKLEWSE